MATVVQINGEIAKEKEALKPIQDEINKIRSRILPTIDKAMRTYKRLLDLDCSDRKHNELPNNKKDCWNTKEKYRGKYNLYKKRRRSVVINQLNPLLKEEERILGNIDDLERQRASAQKQEEENSFEVSTRLANQGKTTDSVLEEERQQGLTEREQASQKGKSVRHGQELTKDAQNAILEAKALSIKSKSENNKKLIYIVVAVGIAVVLVGGWFLYKQMKKIVKK